MCSVCAIVISFDPDIDTFIRTIEAVAPQVDNVLIVDNNSKAELYYLIYALAVEYSSEIIRLESNYGLAKGQNLGITWALEKGYSHVLLLDQDSVPYPDMVSKLVEASILLQQKNKNIAAVGPVYVNSITGTHSYFVRFNVFGLNRIYCSDKNTTNYILSDFLISSGCLISLDIFKYIGMMDERLFIDHVDTEWFVRAKSKDYSSYGVCDAFMEHNIGEKTIRLWFHRKKEIGKHNPVRLYYNIRNSLLLLRYNYCTLKICFVLIKRTLTLSLFYILFVSPRTEYIKYVYRAIKDAFLEKSGKIELT